MSPVAATGVKGVRMAGPDEEQTGLGILLFVAYRAMENRALAAVAGSGFDDVTLAQARVFERIGRHGTRLTELAERAQVTKQTAGYLVDQLERAGYVERRPDPTDARARLVCVSEKGAEAVAVASAEVGRVEAEWEAHLGAAEMRRLRKSLERLREITDPYR
jgi:DNA-binding MarR family transcriptional regulator